jgi:hypothetical protein
MNKQSTAAAAAAAPEAGIGTLSLIGCRMLHCAEKCVIFTRLNAGIA